MTSGSPQRISAIVPTHRRAELLGEAVASIASQTTPPSELLIVSDVEDGATVELVAGLQERLPFPVRYIFNEDQPGACGSRNLGAANAVGDWLAFLDDDDIWRPTFLERCWDTARRDGASFVFTALLELSERGERLRTFPEGLTRETLFTRPGGLTGSNFVISKDRFLSVRGFDPAVKVFNDWDLLFRLVADRPEYSVVDEPLVEWRQHEGARIGSLSLKRAEGIERFVERYADYMPKDVICELRATAASIRRDLSRNWAEYAASWATIARLRGAEKVRHLVGARR